MAPYGGSDPSHPATDTATEREGRTRRPVPMWFYTKQAREITIFVGVLGILLAVICIICEVAAIRQGSFMSAFGYVSVWSGVPVSGMNGIIMP